VGYDGVMIDLDARYRCNLLTMIPVDHGVRNRVSSFDATEKYLDLSGDETGLLMSSNNWQTIARHVEIFTVRYPEHRDNASQYIHILQRCVEKGLLVSEDDVRARIIGSIEGSNAQIPAFAGMTGKDTGMTKINEGVTGEVVGIAEKYTGAHVDDARRIEMIGIPTRNRPTELARCIESYMGNVLKYGRTPEFVVADDSEGEFLEKNRVVIDILRKKYPGIISHHDISKRKEFAQQRAQETAIEQEVVEFTVCGDDTDQNHVGALRNFLLLYAKGRKILMVDDDTICTIHTLPGYRYTEQIENLKISSMPPRPSWFFDSYEAAVNYFPAVEVDYLGEHEKLLGKDVSTLISGVAQENIHFDPELGGMTSKLFVDIQNGAFPMKKIVVTFPGIVGHSWMRAHPPTMVDHTSHPHNLWGNSEEEYRKNRLSPNIARMTNDYTLYNGAEYLGLMALDTSLPLPLFPPVGTNEDANFGYLMTTYFPEYISGIIPYAIEHRRTSAYTPVVDIKPASFSTWSLTTIVMETLHRNTKPSDQTLEKLSTGLLELSRHPAEVLQRLVLDGIRHRMNNSLEYHRRLKAYHANKPDYWHRDVDEIIQQTEMLLQNDLSVLIPFFNDMNVDGTKKFGWGEFRRWVGKYSRKF
jgi:hypothetical protein